MQNQKKRDINGILLIYHRPVFIQSAATISENIESFRLYSSFPVWQVNTAIGFPRNLSGLTFNVVILHYTLFGRGHKYELTRLFCEYLLASRSHKIAFFQDEYRYCQKRFKFIDEFNIDTVYTCLEPQYHKEVYFKYAHPKRVKYYFPGYVSCELSDIASRFQISELQKTIDVGYRARKLEYYMGKGAQEKYEIGKTFKRLCQEKNLPVRLDIDVEERGRLYGDKWYRFLANCIGILGVESGVSIFDLQDEVRITCDKLLIKDPKISFEEVSLKVLREWENNIPLRTISPRHFEAAAFNICQILFEGRYSGVLEPYRHYIPLKKDYTNFDDVIKQLQDTSLRVQMTKNAYADLINSGKYSYRTFISDFDADLRRETGLERDPKLDKSKVSAMLHSDEQERKVRTFAKNLLYLDFPGKAGLRGFIKRVYRNSAGH